MGGNQLIHRIYQSILSRINKKINKVTILYKVYILNFISYHLSILINNILKICD